MFVQFARRIFKLYDWKRVGRQYMPITVAV